MHKTALCTTKSYTAFVLKLGKSQVYIQDKIHIPQKMLAVFCLIILVLVRSVIYALT